MCNFNENVRKIDLNHYFQHKIASSLQNTTKLRKKLKLHSGRWRYMQQKGIFT